MSFCCVCLNWMSRGDLRIITRLFWNWGCIYMTIIFCWSVSAVPREHVSPGEPANGNVCSAGPCRWRWRGLQWKGHIWLHAQRLHCACIQHPPRHRCSYTPFTHHMSYTTSLEQNIHKHLHLIKLDDVKCSYFFYLLIPKTPKQPPPKKTKKNQEKQTQHVPEHFQIASFNAVFVFHYCVLQILILMYILK